MVEEKKETAVATTAESKVPAYLKQYEGEGGEDFTLEELKPSFVQCAQFTSQAFKDKLVEAGEFFDSVTTEIFGQDVTFTVVKKEKLWLRFPTKEDKKEDKNAKIKRSRDGLFWDDGSELTKDDLWKYETYRFLIVVRGNLCPIPYVLSLKGKAGKGAGKDLASVLGTFTKAKCEPIFARAFKLSSKVAKNNEDQEYYALNIQPAGWSEEKEATLAHNIREELKKTPTKYDVDKAEDDNMAENSGDHVEAEVVPDDSKIQDDELE